MVASSVAIGYIDEDMKGFYGENDVIRVDGLVLLFVAVGIDAFGLFPFENGFQGEQQNEDQNNEG